MSIKNFFDGGKQISDSTGAPLNGGLCYFYDPTTTTPKNTYTTSALTVANANPVVLDSSGRANIWLNGNYRVIVKDSSGNTIYDEDNINPQATTTPTAITTSTALVLADSGKVLEVNGAGITVTLAAASTLGAGWYVDYISTDATNSFTFGRANTGNTINGTAANLTVGTKQAGRIYVNNAANGFYTEGDVSARGANTFSGANIFSSTLSISGALQQNATALKAGTLVVANAAATGVTSWAPRAYMSGLTFANNSGDATNDLDIAAGEATDSTNVLIMKLASTLTKQSDVVWAVGTGLGGLDTGAVGNSDYYIWLIVRSDTGVVDALYSLSSTAPTMPTNYDFKRLIGWFKRVGGTIVAFHTYERSGGGIELLWDSPTLDVNLANTLTTTARTDALKVPLNFSVDANIHLSINDATTNNVVYISCPDVTDLAPSSTAAPLASRGGNTTGLEFVGQNLIKTSATGTIRSRSSIATVDSYLIATLGFTWGRRN